MLQFNFLSSHLAPITDKKQIDSFCWRFFFTPYVCVCTGVCACTPQKSWWLPFLGCVCGTLVSSAVYTAALALTVPLTKMPIEHNNNQHLLFLFYFYRTHQGWSHRTLWMICRQRKTQFLRCVWAICVSITTAWWRCVYAAPELHIKYILFIFV